MSGNLRQYPVQKVELKPPPLEELAQAISTALTVNFRNGAATVEECPDLRSAPFHLAAPGLCGHRRIADVGGQSNLNPVPDLSKKYDLLEISRLMELSPETGSLLGAGAGPFHVLGVNSELMPNIAYGAAINEGPDGLRNLTRYAKILDDDSVRCELVDASNVGFGLMCNLYGSDGHSGPCLHIKAVGRKGNLNFTETIQAGLHQSFGDRLISIGGVFFVKHGKCNLHVMPGFRDEPFRNRADVEGWLRYFETDPPIICLSVFHSGHGQGLGLRMEHTHCFSVEGGTRGGHYHNDLDETMGQVEYEGWFNVAEVLYRIDSTVVSS
jgi:hypothetical protein